MFRATFTNAANAKHPIRLGLPAFLIHQLDLKQSVSTCTETMGPLLSPAQELKGQVTESLFFKGQLRHLQFRLPKAVLLFARLVNQDQQNGQCLF